MDNQTKGRSHLSQNLVLFALIIFLCQCAGDKSANNSQNTEILVKRLENSNNTGKQVPKIYKVTQDGREEEFPPSTFTMKSDPVNVQSDFSAVKINVQDKYNGNENGEKVDLRKNVEISGADAESAQPASQNDSGKTQKIKENSESRLFSDDEFFGYHQDEIQFHHPSKRSGDDYYADESSMESSPKPPSTNEPVKEEESFFSIFESLFGSSDDEAETKKKSQVEEDEMKFKDPEGESIKENIKTVGDLLKPLKPAEEPESKTKNAYMVYQGDVPEYRIVNNFHVSQSQKPGYKPPDSQLSYHSSYRPITERPYKPYKTHSTSGYEDYDLEEFLDKTDTVTRVKYLPPITTPVRRNPVVTTPVATTTTTTTTTPKPTVVTPVTTTTIRTTSKNPFENKVKFPSVQKKNDYINKNRYQGVKNEPTEKLIEKETERTTYVKPETKATTEKVYTAKNRVDYHEISKLNEIKTQKVQESPNFYNLINLPVKYSTKDTAIPLISTSYANTKIQGMGAHKYDKGSNGKYPNHKYDSTNVVTTRKPSYWATKRIESTELIPVTEKHSTAFSSSIKPAPQYISSKDHENVEYDPVQTGMGPEFGGYGSKKGAEENTVAKLTRVTSTIVPQKETTGEFDIIKTGEKKETIKYVQPITDVKPAREDHTQNVPEDYDYDIVPAKVEELRPASQNYPPNFAYVPEGQHKNEVEYGHNVGANYKETYEPGPGEEIAEYEYYDYDFDVSTTTSTTTTPPPKIGVKYSTITREILKAEPSNEKVAVVVPTKDQTFYTENYAENNQPTYLMSSASTTQTSTTTTKPTVSTHAPTATTATTTTTTTPKPTTPTTVVTLKQGETEGTTPFRRPTVEIQKVNFISKENVGTGFQKEQFQSQQSPKIISAVPIKNFYTEKPDRTVPPMIVTSAPKQQQEEQESNVNIVLVPAKETTRTTEKTEEKYTKTEPPTIARQTTTSTTTTTTTITPTSTTISTTPKPNVFSLSATHGKPDGLQHSNYVGYTTEFTVGAVHGHGGNSVYSAGINKPNPQGHFVASSIVTNPYGHDEPFRPIPKPTGMTASFQVVRDDGPIRHPQIKPNQVPFQNKSPVSLTTNSGDRPLESSHEPHEFIPSPQFHRPTVQKPSTDARPADLDYELEGIQTQPKPGQYVIFSKPQLNPELNESQLKKKPEIKVPKPGVSNVPFFHDKDHLYSQESQEHIIFNPKEGQFYHSGPSKKPILPEKPIYLNLPEKPHYLNPPEKPVYQNPEEELPLELVPPRGIQTEKPFDRNFVTPETDHKETTVGIQNYPRPHWEKNGKPSFLFNNNPIKNEMTRVPPMPNQMSQTLMPPNNIPPQRFRRPIPHPPHGTPSRKNFNEASSNVKPKPSLPNILPQFRPNTKVGSGPYHRPNAYLSPNRRNGINRFHDNERGNFPYHIHYPEKEGPPPREYEMGPEIVPKFITNRGKLPGDVWNNGMQKRFGQSPQGSPPRLDAPSYPPQGPKVLKRLQRNPVTTLQMLKQMPGMNTHNIHVKREGDDSPSASLVSPLYRRIVDKPKTEENVYVVYPAKAPQKLVPENNGKVFIVSDTKSHKKFTNFTKSEDQQYLLSPTKKENKTDFAYAFSKSKEKSSGLQNEQKENEKGKTSLPAINISNKQITQPIFRPKNEKIDMNLHMQSNNQWNEVKSTLLTTVLEETEHEDNQHHFTKQKPDLDGKPLQVDPPSAYQTSIREDGKGSSLTLGAVMHTVPDASRKGLIPDVPLHSDQNKPSLPRLNVNERISNGKIITVSMPLDVKEEPEEGSSSNTQGFQAPFQPSSSIDSNGSYSPNQGWKVVHGPENKIDEKENENETTEASTTRFSFENFKPELIGGFKPLFQNPEDFEEAKPSQAQNDEETERDEKLLRST